MRISILVKVFVRRANTKRAGTLLLLLGALGWCTGSASAAVLNVGSCVHGGFPTINLAVAAANSGDTVSVCPGTYPEIVAIDKNLTLVGKSSSDSATLVYPGSGQCANSPFTADCPQIVVANATVQIERLTIDGSAFSADCDSIPVGIVFLQASGGALFNNIQNHNSTCVSPPGTNGIGIWSLKNDVRLSPLLVQGNYIDNFGLYGIYADAVPANVLNNSIGVDNPGNFGMYLFNAVGSSALNNTVWGTGTEDNQLGIYVNSTTNGSLTRNNVRNIYRGIEVDNTSGSTLNGNAVKDAFQGIGLECADSNKLISNTVTNYSTITGSVGVNIYDCLSMPPAGSVNNLLNGNKFKGLCSGILTGLPINTGNTLISNTFANISPGANVMAGNTCP